MNESNQINWMNGVNRLNTVKGVVRVNEATKFSSNIIHFKHVVCSHQSKFLLQHSTFKYVVSLTMLSLELDVHQVVKSH